MWCRRIFLLLLWALITPPAAAQAVPPLQGAAVASTPPGTDSEKAHILSLLIKGDIDQAITYWGVANIGRQAPAWLVALKTSYEVSRQAAGQCQAVARGIHTAFTQLGGKPQFVELRNADKTIDYMVFRTAAGRDLNVTRTGYHVLVRLEGRAYDAFTGPSGLPWREYMSRLGSRSEIVEEVVAILSQGSP